jgi:hypothetical protein
MESLSSTPPPLGMGRFPATRASTDAWMRHLQVHYDAGGEITDDGYPTRQHDLVMERLSQGFWRTLKP